MPDLILMFSIRKTDMQGELKNLRESRFIRNVVVAASGAAGAQLIVIVFSPLITRLYGPQAFGLLGTFAALVAIGAPVAALTYPIAIVLPRTDGEAAGIVRLAVYIALGIGVLLTFSAMVVGDRLLASFAMTELTPYILLVPLLMVLTAFRNVGLQWLIRDKQFRVMAKVAVLQALTVNTLKVVIGFFHPVAAVLIGVTVIGGALHVLMLMLGIKLSIPDNRKSSRQPDTRNASFLELAKRYRDFPVYRAPQALINAFSHSLPVIMLAAFFGPVSAGLYTLCTRILAGIPQLISVSVGDVFYPRFSEAVRRGDDLARLLLKATVGLALLGVAPFAIVILIGPWLFGWFFGPDWVYAGVYARWLSVWLFFQFINRPCVIAVPALGIQKGLMFYEIAGTTAKLLALVLGFALFKSDIVAIAFFSVMGMTAYLFLIFWVLISARSIDAMRL